MVKNKNNSIEKPKRGRPAGSKNKVQAHFDSAVLIKNSIRDAMLECEKRGRPLHLLLADEMSSGSASKVLQALSKFMPSELNVNVSNSFSDALTELKKDSQE